MSYQDYGQGNQDQGSQQSGQGSQDQWDQQQSGQGRQDQGWGQQSGQGSQDQYGQQQSGQGSYGQGSCRTGDDRSRQDCKFGCRRSRDLPAGAWYWHGC